MRRSGRGGASSVWTPASLPGIRHWYNTDSGNYLLNGSDIETYYDLIGTADLTAGAGDRPAYSATAMGVGKPGASFDYANTEAMSVVLPTAIPQPFSIACAVRWTGAGAGGTPCAIGGSLTRYFLRRNNATQAIEFHAGVGTVSTPAMIALNTTYVVVIVANGTSSRIRVDGVTRFAASTNIGSNACSNIILGNEALASYHDGAFGEAIFLAGDVSANQTDLVAIEQYLMSKFK